MGSLSLTEAIIACEQLSKLMLQLPGSFALDLWYLQLINTRIWKMASKVKETRLQTNAFLITASFLSACFVSLRNFSHVCTGGIGKPAIAAKVQGDTGHFPGQPSESFPRPSTPQYNNIPSYWERRDCYHLAPVAPGELVIIWANFNSNSNTVPLEVVCCMPWGLLITLNMHAFPTTDCLFPMISLWVYCVPKV